MRSAGLEPEVDGARNLIGRRGEAACGRGSHLDSVPNGGKFDGALGVVAANRGGGADCRMRRSVSWRFEPRRPGRWGASGSRQLPDAFVELHIEQGPVLERAGEPGGGDGDRRAGARRGRLLRGVRITRGRRRCRRGRMLWSRRRDSSCTCASALVTGGRDGRGDRGRAERGERRPGAGDGGGRRACARRGRAGRARCGDRVRAELAARSGGRWAGRRTRCCATCCRRRRGFVSGAGHDAMVLAGAGVPTGMLRSCGA